MIFLKIYLFEEENSSISAKAFAAQQRGRLKVAHKIREHFLPAIFFLQILLYRSRQMGYVSFLLTEETENN